MEYEVLLLLPFLIIHSLRIGRIKRSERSEEIVAEHITIATSKVNLGLVWNG